MRTIILVGTLMLTACGPQANTVPASTNVAAPAPGPAAATTTDASRNPISGTPIVTLAKAAELKQGMTYAEVKAILGSDGFLGAKSEETMSYAWTNDAGGTLDTTFKNGKLTDTNNFGLK